MTPKQYFLCWAAAFFVVIVPTAFLVVKWAIISANLWLRRHP